MTNKHLTIENQEILLQMGGLELGDTAVSSDTQLPLIPTFVYNDDGTGWDMQIGDIPNDWKNATSFGGGNPDNQKDNLIIGNSVASIGSYAFRGWNSNNHPLVIPDSVTSIGFAAFGGWNSNDQPLVIPDSVTSIGNYAFGFWTANNQPLVIPDSVTSIGNDAFRFWTANNQPLVIGDSVTSIGNYAFQGWDSNDQPLVIPDSVTSIGNYAFQGWDSNDQPLVIPDSVTSIESNAFSDWTAMTEPIYFGCPFSALTGSDILRNNTVTQIYARASQGWPVNTTQNISGSPNTIEILEWENYPVAIPNN